jgi:uncharacterized phiE125 gp8 family phage protein
MQYRSLRTVTPPVVEPVSLSEAKTHCRVDSTTDDAYIAALITAAREWVEVYMDESLIHQQLTMRLDFFPVEIDLPRPPMATEGTATAVTVTYTIDESMQTATLSQSQYRVDRDARPGVIRNVYGGSWPSHLSDQNSVSVTWWAGRGPSGASTPQGVRNAILMLVGHWYERRLAADAGSLNEIPFGVKALLDSRKWGSYR